VVLPTATYNELYSLKEHAGNADRRMPRIREFFRQLEEMTSGQAHEGGVFNRAGFSGKLILFDSAKLLFPARFDPRERDHEIVAAAMD